ncbi:AcrR family transcriptional regulator [Rhizobium petrolearium]|uniref:CerR family C-terminal domain-containing protein n=1 Tax=Neorhizobium petrolearium TaxID=515361 RepID=UPI001AE7E2D1|nr:CerR family C-terminal domain-containing protein [Neorhizobium petrolearium]MBP1847588.1 AcrR family transcriptional regulator [Neorhizobium petrolearium]
MNNNIDLPSATSSETTRIKLIDAGLRLFAQFGIDGVRTRVLAHEAGVNQAAIPYHFGGKEGVYSAVIAETAREMKQGLDDSGLMAVTAGDISTMSPLFCRDHLQALMRAFALMILAPGRPRERTALIVREQLQPTENFSILYEIFIEPLHSRVSSLVARLNEVSADDKKSVVKAHAIIGQVLAFAVAQNSYLRRAQRHSILVEDAEQIADILAEMALKSLRE